MPHDEIICAKFLKPLVRGTVLINRIVSEPEEYGSGNCARCMLCENYEPNARFDDVLVNVAEK